MAVSPTRRTDGCWGHSSFGLLHRPSSPGLPWRGVEPILPEEARQTAVFGVWLLAVAVLVVLSWLACKPGPRRHPDELEHPPTGWMPSPRDRRRPANLQPSADLAALFAALARTQREPLCLLRPAMSDRPTRQLRDRCVQTQAPEDGDAASEGTVMLRLFGRIRVDGTGRTGLNQRATRGLIAYLALKRGPATMDEILDALWPDEAPAITQHRFWKSWWRQAQQVLGDALTRSRDGYELNRSLLENRYRGTRTSLHQPANRGRGRRRARTQRRRATREHRLPVGRQRAPPPASNRARVPPPRCAQQQCSENSKPADTLAIRN